MEPPTAVAHSSTPSMSGGDERFVKISQTDRSCGGVDQIDGDDALARGDRHAYSGTDRRHRRHGPRRKNRRGLRRVCDGHGA